MSNLQPSTTNEVSIIDWVSLVFNTWDSVYNQHKTCSNVRLGCLRHCEYLLLSSWNWQTTSQTMCLWLLMTTLWEGINQISDQKHKDLCSYQCIVLGLCHLIAFPFGSLVQNPHLTVPMSSGGRKNHGIFVNRKYYIISFWKDD